MAKRSGFRDTFEEIFGEDPDPKDEKYPGSNKSRREKPPSTEFVHDHSWRDVYTVKRINGKEQRFYTIGALAQALGVSTYSIKYWVRNGHVPNAPYRLPDMIQGDGLKRPGRRLYTAPMIDAVVELFDRHGLLGAQRIDWKKHEDVTADILQEWTRITKSSSDLLLDG